MRRNQIAALLIEDNPGDVVLTRTMLADPQHSMTCALESAESLAAGLQRVAQGGIDVVLLDLQLPDSAGLDTLRRLRSAAPQELAVVVMSGHGDDETGVQAVQEGAQDYLIKGQFDGGLLLRSMRYAVERQEAEQALRQARAELERQVLERTSSLASAVQSLQEEIEQRKWVEESLRQAKDAADEANRAKDQFFAVLSHELRTPLTPVLATVILLEKETGLSGCLREDLQLIRRNVELETKLIDDLLDFTRLARGKVHLHCEVIDVHACLLAALQVCQGQIQAKHLAVDRRLEAQEYHAWADPARLQQVFWNLLQNAAKFTPQHGTIHLRSRNQGGRLLIEVEDSGIGIEPAALPRIFSAFVQAEQTKTRRFGGLGMGLTIAKNIMDLHHGQLTAFSEGPDRGATFTAELAALSTQASMAVSPAAPAQEPRQGGHILLVEDNPDTLQVLARVLSRWGHTVTPADSVHAALEAAAHEGFDLLISDIGLPDGSGLDIMRRVKQAYGLRGIAVSGYGMEEDVKQSQAAGFERHLTKPVNFDVLRAAVCAAVPG